MNDAVSEKKAGPTGISVCVLASGSKGNAIYITDGITAVLIDAGLSGKEIERRMALREIDPNNLDAILISHEHTDHVIGAGVLSRRFKIPLFLNEKTFYAARKKIGRPHEMIYFDCGLHFRVGTLDVHPFSISHDAADPSGFTIESGGKKIGVATDLGIANLVVRQHLLNCHLLVLETNHDPDMLLENENYPWELKQRVRGRKGHLSNEDAGGLLAEIICHELSHIVLAHLSQENNTPERAFDVIHPVVRDAGISISVASQDEPDEIIVLS